jgi:hypothetical protein
MFATRPSQKFEEVGCWAVISGIADNKRSDHEDGRSRRPRRGRHQRNEIESVHRRIDLGAARSLLGDDIERNSKSRSLVYSATLSEVAL